jgi:hypothetical protein
VDRILPGFPLLLPPYQVERTNQNDTPSYVSIISTVSNHGCDCHTLILDKKDLRTCFGGQHLHGDSSVL